MILVVLAVVGLYFYVQWHRSPSGGVMPPEEAAYDVRHVDLQVRVLPQSRSISGSAETRVRVLDSVDSFLCDLDHRLTVHEVRVDGRRASFNHAKNRLRVELESSWNAGESHSIFVRYGGRPKVALKAPWIGGFVWKKTPVGGEPWIGVACQEDGSDIWWPSKDHPSEEPEEGMDIALTVPKGLVGLSNGAPLGTADNGNGTVTSRWKVHYPINQYDVTLNVAPYVSIEERYHGVDGTLDVPILFWALPEHEEKARRMWKQAPHILEVLGRYFGEYPFLKDKYWVAEAPYLGMEHQSLVAYGDTFTDNSFGFDAILLHETAHEWWGNKVTVSDWADFWLHEAFATYAEALYVDATSGHDRYLAYMARMRSRIRNRKPIVQGKNLDSIHAYTGDIYFKGAWVLHTLRWLIGDQPFLKILHDFPNDPRYAYGHATTRDFIGFVRAETGLDLQWFWQRYLYTAHLPRWSLRREPDGAGERVELSWDDPAFELPLPVAIGDGIERVEMPGGRGSVVVPPGTEISVDPKGLVLAERGR